MPVRYVSLSRCIRSPTDHLGPPGAGWVDVFIADLHGFDSGDGVGRRRMAVAAAAVSGASGHTDMVLAQCEFRDTVLDSVRDVSLTRDIVSPARHLGVSVHMACELST